MIRKTIAAVLLCSIGSHLFAQQVPTIIPYPVSIQVKQGVFVLDNDVSLLYPKELSQLMPAIKWFDAAIKEIAGINLLDQGVPSKTIRLVQDSRKVTAREGYHLDVNTTTVTITAADYGGFFYGMQSLLQNLPSIRTNAPLQIPCMVIADSPRFAWRGMHLDVSRHFFGPAVIKQYIDLMAAYKLNTFHWHLVDDQGWRIEIKKYPELTRTGAWRVNQNHLVWGDRPQAIPGQKADYGGFYTQDQIKEIISYAAARNVTIVPEIEMPGHVASAIASYPHLSCTQKPQLPLTGGNYNGMSSNYCAGNDAVFGFLEDVLSEVITLFPSHYIHIGGDEVDKNPWKKCARCQARMQQHQLKNEEELQSYFIKRIEKFVKAKGRSIIGWDEILEGGLAPEAAVMSWRGEAGGIEAARMDHPVVMTPGKPLYFDHYQAGPAGEPMAIGGMNTLKNVYDYEPVPAELPADKAKYVMGAQANLWTEYVTTASQVEYMILPRMLALSEALWLPKSERNWAHFSQRIKSHMASFEQKGLNYCPGNYTVAIHPRAENGKLSVSLETEIPDASIVYTVDGSEPDINSTPYATPVAITNSVTLKAAVVQYGKIMGREAAKQSFTRHLAMGAPVQYKNPVSRYYQADGPHSLTDGVRGTMAVGKYWHGFSGRDLIATLDLGKPSMVSTLSIGCLQKYNDWIFLPGEVVFEWSEDGIVFQRAGSIKNPHDRTVREIIHSFQWEFASPVKARFIRVTAINGVCPEGHPGAGKPAWIFADEITVK